MALAAASSTNRSALRVPVELAALLDGDQRQLAQRVGADGRLDVADRAGAALDRVHEVADVVLADRQLDRHRVVLVLRIAQELLVVGRDRAALDVDPAGLADEADAVLEAVACRR